MTSETGHDDRLTAVLGYLAGLQKDLGTALGSVDGGKFAEEPWQSSLGRGRGLRMEGGAVFERAGVNFSEISGESLPPAASARRPELAGKPYQAAGVSLVAHPANPHCPSVHLNVRFFSAGEELWFGGGMDLTPHYGYEEDCRHFHKTCKSALDSCDPALYPEFKSRCDEYFYIKHRGEMRGIGGVFFDDFCRGGFDAAFAVMRSVGDAFADAYLPIIKRRKDAPFGDRQRKWQLLRRGRYVEFNLIYDRGTLFGLQSGGRAESILMSLPPLVEWNASLPPGKPEEDFAKNFLQPKKWA